MGRIYFDYPVQTKSVSVTGQGCALDCAHCGGHYLEKMLPLAQISMQAEKQLQLPFKSLLVSGGCTPEGKVPFYDHLEMLKELKNKKIRLNFHVGLINEEEISLLKGLADTVSFDFVVDNETIREVYGLNKTGEDYRRVYQELNRAVPVMPHLTLGLRGGRWSGEEMALDALEELGLKGLTFIVFIPTPGTRYGECESLPVEEVIDFLARARTRFPDIPLSLGCMRPKGRYRQILDEAAVAIGIDRVVMPTPAARKLAIEKGMEIIEGEECCAL